VVGSLGRGGMGDVVLAEQRSLARSVALKRPRGEAGTIGPDGQLIREARLAGSLEHPNIVPIHALGRDEADRPVLVMKRVDGVDWETLLADPQHPAWAAVPGSRLVWNVEVLMDVCFAAQCAHERGIVHRDIKPANVMIGPLGEVYLVDWGIAVSLPEAVAERRPPGAAGTLAYLAPEMVRDDGAAVSASSDVYLLGATLYHVLAGGPPHVGADTLAVVQHVLLGDPPPLPADAPPELVAACRRAMDPDPARRFASARDLRQALADYLEHRASNELAAAAAERLEQLRHEARTQDDPFRVRKLFHECRFGFDQAVRSWPDNAAARAGLRETLALMLEHELRQRDVTDARALRAELDGDWPELDARLAALEREIAAERADADRLRRLEHDLDARVSRRERDVVLLLFTIAVAAIVTAGAVSRALGHDLLSPVTAVLTPAALLAAGVVTVVALRRTLLANAINRRLVFSLLITLGALTANRAWGLAAGLPLRTVLAQDLLIAATIGALLGVILRPAFHVVAGTCLVGLVAALRWPGQTQLVVELTLLACVLVFGAARRRRRDD